MTNKFIIILRFNDNYEAWGSLTELCENHPNFSYSTLKGKKFPFKYKGFYFIKVKYRHSNK